MEDRSKITRQDIKVVRRTTEPYCFVEDKQNKITVPDLKAVKEKKSRVDGFYCIINVNIE